MSNGVLARQFSTLDKLTQPAPFQMSMSNLLSYIMYNIYIQNMFMMMMIVYVKGETIAVSAEMMLPWFETRLPTILLNYIFADIYHVKNLDYVIRHCLV